MINTLNLFINKIRFFNASTKIKQNLYPTGINTNVLTESKKVNYDFLNVQTKNFCKIIPKIKNFYQNLEMFFI